MKLTECLNTFDSNEINLFWQFIDSIKWAPKTNCKVRLLKELSPSQSSRYRRILDYICENFAEQLSSEYNFNNIFDAKAYCSNVIGEEGYNGLVRLENSMSKVVDDISTKSFLEIEDIFLFMIPNDDDYWHQ